MVNEDSTLRLPAFHGMERDDVEQDWFTCEDIWFVKRFMDGESNISQLETTFRNIALKWYMKYKVTALVGQIRSLTEIKRDILREFQKPKSKSQCITEIK
jgi:hypothetical protein